ncbi:MAG: glutathione peroxidase [Bacteroidota bacterium]
MPLPLPLKWKQSFYRITMFFGSKKKVNSPSMINAITSIYSIPVNDINGKQTDLHQYKGKKLLIVNVASECGYTPQYGDLEQLYTQHKDKLVVLGFPTNDFGGQEPGTESEIEQFCRSKYSIDFPLFSKITVIGDDAHPLYKWLSDEKLNGWNNKAPSWNFCKYLVDENGNLLNYFSANVDPFEEDILNQLV